MAFNMFPLYPLWWEFLPWMDVEFCRRLFLHLLRWLGFPDSLVGKESACSAGDPGLIPGSGRSAGVRGRLPSPVFLGFPDSSVGKESTCNAGDLGSIPGLGRSPGEGKGYPLQYSGLENSMDSIVHGVAKSQTRLSDFHFHWDDHIVFILQLSWCVILISHVSKNPLIPGINPTLSMA